MPKRYGLLKLSAVAAVAAVVAAPQAVQAADPTLHAVTGLPINLDFSKSFIKNFIEPAQKSGKGIVNINFKGGSEVIPGRKAGDALRRGQIDLLHCPSAYHIGLVPEGYVFTLSTKSAAEIRKNGGFELLQKIWAERMNARFIAWGESGTSYHTYLGKKPSFTADGKLSLKGFKMRTTGTYRPLFRALGATAIGMSPTEIYTGMKRGVVDGFGWPDTGAVSLGLAKVIKYRIDPPYYTVNPTVTVNLDKWKTLSRKAQDYLETKGREYEANAITFMEVLRKKDEKILLAAGMQKLLLKGAAAKHYVNAANVAVWDSLKKRSKYAAQLQALVFPDWHPPQTN